MTMQSVCLLFLSQPTPMHHAVMFSILHEHLIELWSTPYGVHVGGLPTLRLAGSLFRHLRINISLHLNWGLCVKALALAC
ncbi:hypothetical protein BDW68DRAFT_164001 [Aspergillus falconensis]